MRLSVKLMAVAAVAAAALCLGNAPAAETVKISECMKCQNGARTGLKKMAKEGKYDWDEAAKSTKSWVEAAGDLAKNKPPLGDEKSWKEQTDKYLTNVKAVDGAVQKKDSTALGKAMGTFDSSCGACHSKHKPKN
jgi:cytochrome c556